MAGRPCTVCRHSDRRTMELAVTRGEEVAAVSRRFAGVSDDSLRRHMASHARKAMVMASAAIGRRDLASGLGLTEEASDLYDRTVRILDEAERAKKLPVALLAIREARGNLELLGKFTGKIKPETQVNVLVMPEWLSLRDRILAALEAHPAALAAVQEAMGAEPR